MLNNAKAVAVTGGAGFIGSHLVEELLNHDLKIVIIDDLSTGRIENIQPFLSNSKVVFIEGSILDLPLVNKAFSGIHYVFHQAAIASVSKCIEQPVESNQTNLSGTLNVLLAARDNKVKKVIMASSAAVYGDDLSDVKREDLISNHLSPYAVQKLAGELYCQVFSRLYNLPTTCLRYFNVFGPRQDPHSEYAGVIVKFLERISKGEPVKIYGDGQQTRDFVYVKDVVEANLLFAENEISGVYNIGTGIRTSLNQLCSSIYEIMQKAKITPIYESARLGDIKHSLADIAKARSAGYVPRYNLEMGIRELLEVARN